MPSPATTSVPAATRPPASRCRLCGAPAGIALRGPPAVLECGACGLLVLEDFPDREAREAGYQEHYYRDGTGDRFFPPLEWALELLKRLRFRAIARRVSGPGRILDVGCGRGDLLELFGRRGWEALGTQVSRTAAAAARSRRGVEVLLGELPELPLPESSFDAVTFFHVLEHLDRPDAYLRRARSLLAPGGLLVVEVPNCGGVGFRALGPRHLCFDHPHHLVFFTRSSLEGLLRRSGFRVEEVSHFSLEYSPFTTLQNVLNVLPGEPNRLYRALQRNREGRRLRGSPWTLLHAALGVATALPALAISLVSLGLPIGNTLRVYARPDPVTAARGP